MKRCTTSLIIRAMKIKTMPQCGITLNLVRMAVIKKTRVGEDVQNREAVENINWYSHHGKLYGFSKLKKKKAYDPIITLLVIYPKENK